ncbi:MAG: PhnD/SsuA/transferrin family substrate-binding protein, partial [Silvanigrellaceae bacterium]|nr:PhnD/SsuA/transferrin family substrate-binding protein [Silvanigrellaceae bacterium]
GIGRLPSPEFPATGKYRDSRNRLLTMYPNIMNDTRVIWISEEIPNEPVMIRKNIPLHIKDKIIKHLPECIVEHPNTISNIETLLKVDKDNNAYNDFLKSLLKSGIDIVKVLNQKK